MPSFTHGTIRGTTPAFMIYDGGKVMVPMTLTDVDNDRKELLKESVCELIDSMFEQCYDENKI